MFPDTQLSEILFNDLLASDIGVAWLKSTIFSITIAIIVKIGLITVGAFPENVVRSKVD